MFIVYIIIGGIILAVALGILLKVIGFIAAMTEFLGGEFLVFIGFVIVFLVASFFFGRWLLHVLA